MATAEKSKCCHRAEKENASLICWVKCQVQLVVLELSFAFGRMSCHCTFSTLPWFEWKLLSKSRCNSSEYLWQPKIFSLLQELQFGMLNKSRQSVSWVSHPSSFEYCVMCLTQEIFKSFCKSGGHLSMLVVLSISKVICIFMCAALPSDGFCE